MIESQEEANTWGTRLSFPSLRGRPRLLSRALNHTGDNIDADGFGSITQFLKYDYPC